MSQKIYMSTISILGKLDNHEDWLTTFQNVNLPSVVYFQIGNIPEELKEIKKISWDFGDSPKCVNFSNRKGDLSKMSFKHGFKKNIKNETLTIQASVYSMENDCHLTQKYNISFNLVKKKQKYIEPEELKRQIIEFYKTKQMPDGLAEAVNMIANRLAFSPNFINYSYREDMVGDALIKMMKALWEEKFDPLRGNPFSYFTKIAFHAFCHRIKMEKRERNALDEYQVQVHDTLVETGYIPRSSNGESTTEDSSESAE